MEVGSVVSGDELKAVVQFCKDALHQSKDDIFSMRAPASLGRFDASGHVIKQNGKISWKFRRDAINMS